MVTMVRTCGTVSAAGGSKVLRSGVSETGVDSTTGEDGTDKKWKNSVIPFQYCGGGGFGR